MTRHSPMWWWGAKRRSLFFAFFLTVCLWGGFGLYAQTGLVLKVSNLNDQGEKEGIAFLHWEWELENGQKIGYEIHRINAEGEEDFLVARLSSLQTDYSDSLYVCKQTYTYYVKGSYSESDELKWLCSDSVTIEIENKKPPRGVEFDSISVDFLQQNLLLGWAASPEPDVTMYYLLREEEGFLKIFDSISGRDRSFYRDPMMQPSLRRYALHAKDSCGNRSINSSLRTNFQTQAAYQMCDDTVFISSTTPDQVLKQADSLILFGYMDDATRKQLEKRPYSTYPSVSKLSVDDVKGIVAFEWQIIGRENGRRLTATALRDSLEVYYPANPAYLSIEKADYVESDVVELEILTDVSHPFQSLVVERGENEGEKQKMLEVVYADWDSLVFWEDRTVKSDRKYQYSIYVKDFCQRKAVESEICQTLYLKVKKTDPGTQTMVLEWDAQGISTYPVLRFYLYADGEDGQIHRIDSVEVSDGLSDRYEIEIREENKDAFYTNIYWIKGIVKRDAESEVKEISSNRVCLGGENSGKISIYMPSGFCPDGVSPLYRPIGVFFPEDRYSFQIFDRSGKRIFFSTDPQEGWDATYQGKELPGGGYVYRVEVERNHKMSVKKGMLTLIR